MKHHLLILALFAGISLHAAEPSPSAAASETALVCPITGKPANPSITTVYEERTYAFHDEASREKFKAARAASIYEQIGGKAAMDAAVELFYVKVLADPRVNHFFEDMSMIKQKRKQKEFLSAALGGPIPYQGKDMRKAHADIDLTDEHFNAIAEHLQATLTELKVKPELINQIMTAVGSLRNAVLNRPETK